jgi:hypothetical protein
MIIGIAGYAQSGKDTIAEYLLNEHGFTRVAFADGIREALYVLNPLVGAYTLRTVVDANGWEKAKRNVEIRRLLQVLGTEVGRDMLGEITWIKYALNKMVDPYKNYVITDVRYENEADAIRANGGTIWRVNRGGVGPVNDHPSEISMDSYDNYDFIFNNDWGIEDLHQTVLQEIGERGVLR